MAEPESAPEALTRTRRKQQKESQATCSEGSWFTRDAHPNAVGGVFLQVQNSGRTSDGDRVAPDRGALPQAKLHPRGNAVVLQQFQGAGIAVRDAVHDIQSLLHGIRQLD